MVGKNRQKRKACNTIFRQDRLVKMPYFTRPPQRAKTRFSRQGGSKRDAESYYLPYGEGLSDATTTTGESRVSARGGRVGENIGIFTSLIQHGRPCTIGGRSPVNGA
jgi:hypothetical protein